MQSLSELLREIQSLPSGNVYQKTIKGNTYFYHQYFRSGKRYSKLVRAEEVEELKRQILLRKEKEKEYKQRTAAKRITLSEAAKELSGQVMIKDTPVAKFECGILLWLDEKRAPLAIKTTKDLKAFLSLRVIDGSRTNARLLKKALHIQEQDGFVIPLYAYAASISDRYWFKPSHSKLHYKDICFDNDAFSDLALKGELSFFPKQGRQTPELTTVGSFEKGWKRIDGEWWLYKSGKKEALFSELYCSSLATLMGVPTARYEYADGFVRTKNFADALSFEPMASLVGDDDDYKNVFKALLPFGEAIQKEYLRLMAFDAIVANVDRHNENYGFLRDEENGDIVSLAPNFDDNLALLGAMPVLGKNPAKDGLISLFSKFIHECGQAKSLFLDLVFPSLLKEDFEKACSTIPTSLFPDGLDELIDALCLRYEYVTKKLSKDNK